MISIFFKKKGQFGHGGFSSFTEPTEESQTTTTWILWLMLLVSGVFLLMILFGEYGVFAKHRLKTKRIELEVATSQLKEEIQNLYLETEALRSNPQVIEAIARKELGMVAPDEIIYIISNTTKQP